MDWIAWIVAVALSAFALVATGLPLLKSERWWIRGFDYPKPQVLAVCVVAMLAWAFVAFQWSWFSVLVMVGLIAASAWNALLILPFSPVWNLHVATDPRPADCDGNCVSLLMSNVEMENRDFDAVLRMIEERDADVVLLAETDEEWCEALAPAIERYEHHLVQPQGNYYGMVFLTRLDVEDMDIRYVISEDHPSVLAHLRTPAGERFTFYGLHPEPPQVGEDTERRDGELMLVAKEIKKEGGPTIVGGDLNDVAWSHTTREFKRISNMLDPRIGRGLYASFHARYRLARWPLDHLFNSKDFVLREIGLHGNVGSDHFPVYAALCLRPDAAALNADPDDGGDLDEAEEKIRKGRESPRTALGRRLKDIKRLRKWRPKKLRRG